MPFVGHSWIVLLLILLIVLILIGPGKLGDLGSAVGRSMREFRKASHEDDSARPAMPRNP
jgi:sec-independent protein translocase protein TatA